MVGSRVTVTSEDNLKLLTAHCIFNGDQDKVAKYMGITKNAVNHRYRKLITTEKENAIKLGFDIAGGIPMAAGKKRSAPPSNGEAKGEKKAKTYAEDGKDDEDESNKGVKTKKDAGDIKKEAGDIKNGGDD